MPLCQSHTALRPTGEGEGITQAREQVSKPHVSKIAFHSVFSVYRGNAFAFDSDKEQRKLDTFLSWRE